MRYGWNGLTRGHLSASLIIIPASGKKKPTKSKTYTKHLNDALIFDNARRDWESIDVADGEWSGKRGYSIGETYSIMFFKFL